VRVFFCNAFTMPKKFSVLGLPRVASNAGWRLFEGFLISAERPSKPMVAFTRSRSIALPVCVSPAR